MQLIDCLRSQNNERADQIILNNFPVPNDILKLIINYFDFSSALTLKETSKLMASKVDKLHEECKLLTIIKKISIQVINDDISWAGYWPDHKCPYIDITLKRLSDGNGGFVYGDFSTGLLREVNELNFSECMDFVKIVFRNYFTIPNSEYNALFEPVVQRNNAFKAKVYFDFSNETLYLSRVEISPYFVGAPEILPEIKRLESLINATAQQFKLNIGKKAL